MHALYNAYINLNFMILEKKLRPFKFNHVAILSIQLNFFVIESSKAKILIS